MRIEGACHCRNVQYSLDWPDGSPEITARECGCTFCRKHAGAWTSNPDASMRITIQDPAAISVYQFGSRTADFHVCTRCGVTPYVISEIDGHRHSVVNVNTFDNVDPTSIQRAPSSFDSEDLPGRLARRKKGWIGQVTLDREPDKIKR